MRAEGIDLHAQRALDILSALVQRQEISMSPPEIALLDFMGLIRSVSSTDKEQMDAGVQELPRITVVVRELRRKIVESGAAGRRRLVEETAKLEELTRARTTLDALVWCAAAQHFVQPTLVGRRALGDLATWTDRLGEDTLDRVLSRMARLRGGLDAIVDRARGTLVLIDRAEPGVTSPELRAPALILARQGTNTAKLADAFEIAVRHLRLAGVPTGQRLLVGAMVSGDMEPTAELAGFDEALGELRRRGFPRDTEALVAMSLGDFARGQWPDLLTRIEALRSMDKSLDPLEATVLARSPHAPDEAYARYRTALDQTVRLRAPNGDEVDGAAAILASAAWPLEGLLERYARHTTQIAGMFDSPSIAAAMLTVSRLEAPQALDILKEAVGSITRHNFFDATVEIPGLALLLVHGSGPEALRFAVEAGISLPSMAPAVQPLEQPLARDSSWYLWHNWWLYRGTMVYLRTHPLHLHTVPHFG